MGTGRTRSIDGHYKLRDKDGIKQSYRFGNGVRQDQEENNQRDTARVSITLSIVIYSDQHSTHRFQDDVPILTMVLDLQTISKIMTVVFKEILSWQPKMAWGLNPKRPNSCSQENTRNLFFGTRIFSVRHPWYFWAALKVMGNLHPLNLFIMSLMGLSQIKTVGTRKQTE